MIIGWRFFGGGHATHTPRPLLILRTCIRLDAVFVLPGLLVSTLLLCAIHSTSSIALLGSTLGALGLHAIYLVLLYVTCLRRSSLGIIGIVVSFALGVLQMVWLVASEGVLSYKDRDEANGSNRTAADNQIVLSLVVPSLLVAFAAVPGDSDMAVTLLATASPRRAARWLGPWCWLIAIRSRCPCSWMPASSCASWAAPLKLRVGFSLSNSLALVIE